MVRTCQIGSLLQSILVASVKQLHNSSFSKQFNLTILLNIMSTGHFFMGWKSMAVATGKTYPSTSSPLRPLSKFQAMHKSFSREYRKSHRQGQSVTASMMSGSMTMSYWQQIIVLPLGKPFLSPASIMTQALGCRVRRARSQS